jgi:hypothetical protein
LFGLYSLTLKMEAACSSETPVEFKESTRRHIPEDVTVEISGRAVLTGPETLCKGRWRHETRGQCPTSGFWAMCGNCEEVAG